MTATPTGCNSPKQAFTTPEGWQQKAQAADEIALLNRKANALTAEIDKLERRIEALERQLGAEGVLGIISNLNAACNATAERVDVLGRRRPAPTAPSDQFEADTQAMEYIIIGKAWCEDSSLERWFPITADELKKANEEILRAHGYLDSLGVPRSEHPNSKSSLQGRIDCLHGTHGRPNTSKWRDAKTDPPTQSGFYVVNFPEAGTRGLEFDGWHWLYNDTGRPMGNPDITHWHPLPAPPKDGV